MHTNEIRVDVAPIKLKMYVQENLKSLKGHLPLYADLHAYERESGEGEYRSACVKQF